ncbi:MAG: metal-dependent hydrolase [Thermodesulfobacteriota bacterium]|nr:metal-dependent hydrolase [Thermodesulfobacteriota bacterium]
MDLTRRQFISGAGLAMVAASTPGVSYAKTQEDVQTPKSVKRSGKVKIEWLGHGAFRFVSPKGKVVLLDPWISTNPKIPSKYRSFKGFEKVDLILFTHGHVDHFMLPDVKRLVAMYNPDIIAPWEMEFFIKSEIPQAKCMTYQLANKGGMYNYHGTKISMVSADHSSGAQLTGFKGVNRFMGQPVGYVLEFETGFKVYHSGDTGLMADMKLVIGEFYKPDLAILPIGGVFTMGSKEAAYACQMIQPAYVIPEHYGTFPVLEQTPDAFCELVKKSSPSIKVFPVTPGEDIII